MTVKAHRIPSYLWHNWVRTPDGPGTHRCAICYSWTANHPLYRYALCPKLDRRSGKDRRKAVSFFIRSMK